MLTIFHLMARIKRGMAELGSFSGLLHPLKVAWFTALVITVCYMAAGVPSYAAAEPGAEQLYAELARLPDNGRQKRLESGARKEGKLEFIHTFRGRQARGHIRLFERRYPFLTVDMVDMGSQDAAERLIAEETAKRHLTDVLTVGVPDLPVIIKENIVARYPTPATKRIFKQYRGFLDPENRWLPWYWSEHAISYNSNLISADKAPKTWEDLCNPAYKGQVSFDPAETRFLAGLYVMMGEEKLKNWLKCIGENKPIIQRGHEQRMQLMLAGDHAIQGDNYLFDGEKAKQKDPKAPFAVVYTAPILAFAGAMIINKNTPHPYGSALLSDWMLSDESQAYVAREMRGPVAMKHPFLPDNVRVISYSYLSEDIVNRLHEYWNQYIGRKK